MHEFSAASQMVNLVLTEAQRRKVKRVLEVRVIIGKLSFLNPEQVRFAYELLAEGTILEGSNLQIEEKEALVKCSSCGFKGEIKPEDNPYYHFGIPVLRCPKCGGEVEIVEGREFTVKSIKVEV
jgi:hydrogenase nickel incorporation protein HypA/HybF